MTFNIKTEVERLNVEDTEKESGCCVGESETIVHGPKTSTVQMNHAGEKLWKKKPSLKGNDQERLLRSITSFKNCRQNQWSVRPWECLVEVCILTCWFKLLHCVPHISVSQVTWKELKDCCDGAHSQWFYWVYLFAQEGAGTEHGLILT